VRDLVLVDTELFPQIFRVRQTFHSPRVVDVAAEVHAQLAKLRLDRTIAPGQSIAVTAGSRGIANIADIIRAAVEHLKNIGASPFIVPSMGSHGGGTADGQRAILESYGITESTAGCPIRSSMETVVVCHTAEGVPVHFDRAAFEADGVLVCNRVKPHTRFAGPIESGLMKMMLIGLGNHLGASTYHQAFEDHDFTRIAYSVADEVLRRCRVVAGLAIVENAYDQTALIEAVPPAEMLNREKRLLEFARQWMARLPFDRVDVLLIDKIGKDISGVGMDPNVVGRKFDDHKAVEGELPKVKRICLRGLTEHTHGNANGMGMAEFCRSQMLGEVDFRTTRLNALVACHVTAAMQPLDYPSDREMLQAAASTIGMVQPPDLKLMWIRDTLHLTEVECGAVYLKEAQSRDDLEVVADPRPLPFDAAGNLPLV
jgi:hypothetical protein